MLRTMVLSETRHEAGLTLLRILRGGLGLPECLGETVNRAIRCVETIPRTLVLDLEPSAKEPAHTVASQIQDLLYSRRQLGRIEAFSSLPQPQCDRGNLAGQRHPGQFLPHTSSDHPKVEVLEGPWSCRSGSGGSLEHLLEHRVMIAVQPAGHRWPPASDRPAVDDVVVRARPANHRKPGVGPQVSLGPKSPGCLHFGQHQRHTDRPEERDRSQQSPGGIATGLGQHGRLGLWAQLPQHIELGIEYLGPKPHPTLRKLCEPLPAAVGMVDGTAESLDAAGSEQCFDALHHAGAVSNQVLVGTRQRL